MFFNYLSGRYNIPKKIFLKLEKIADTKIENYEENYQNKYMEKKIIQPKMNSFLSEIFGVLNGDGHLDFKNNEISVVGSVLEKDYFNYIKKLFENSFNLKFKIIQQNTKLKLRVYSKKLSKLLNEKYNIPKGNKIGKLRIPEQVYSSKKWLASYIRGLFDTDGTFYIRRKNDPVIEISSADGVYLKEICNVLILLGFSAKNYKKHISLYKKEDIEEFFKK